MILTTANDNKIIHLARILSKEGRVLTLFLRKIGRNFIWYFENEGNDQETPISATFQEEAMQKAASFWKDSSFRFVNCGFRYTLPERDEHGLNALFHQMCSSYSAFNGIYYDEELGSNCYVQNASTEALQIYAALQSKKKK